MKWITGQEDTVYVDKKSKSYNRLVYVHDVDVKIGYLTVGIPAAILDLSEALSGTGEERK